MTSAAFSQQNMFWNSCYEADKDNFKWGKYISTTYTKLALKNSPKKIGLFINKSKNEFKTSAYYLVEFDLIQKHYYMLKKNVTLFIFNKKRDTCNDIKQLLAEKLIKNKYIKFVCIECDKLTDCANAMKNVITKT